MRHAIPTMIFSLLMFSAVFYGIAAFTTWQFNPAWWPEWIRAVVAIAVVAGWLWDARR
ncbi:hypothetical protein ACT3R7_11760 [Halomonas sp. AOP43-A1-21]